MSKQLTYEQVVETLTAVVEERPDYVYKADQRGEFGDEDVDCVYFEDGLPSCIVGHVFNRLGVQRDDLIVEDGFGRRDLNQGTGVGALIQDKVVEPDQPRKTKELLQAVQTAQDNGKPWGYALANGMKAVAIYEAHRVSEENV